jgi:predicted acylesterase/phospholipase RssA
MKLHHFRAAAAGWRVPTAALALLVTAACALPVRLDAVPAPEANSVTVLGMKDIRYWGDESSPAMIREGIASYHRELAYWRETGHQGPLPPANYLAISGGGENGAFGAGLLVGWTAAGTRPEFKLVTGISTGALIAPFAFLGPHYDARLMAVYTRTSANDILEKRSYLAALFDDALASTAPLRLTLQRFVDQKMLDDIAAAYRQGRLLLIGTTDLDEGRPVIWNVGKIAASGQPGALRLVREILRASAAVPGAFPPVMIDVEANGRHYQEMHVDGGASAQVFVYPPSLQVQSVGRAAGIRRERRLYVIRNARLDPEWAQVQRRTLSIVGRAVSSLIQTQGIGDLYRIYVAARRDDIDFNLASIPSSFKMQLESPFEAAYMRGLYEVGYDLGRRGYRWAKHPPGYQDLGVGPTLSSEEKRLPMAERWTPAVAGVTGKEQ